MKRSLFSVLTSCCVLAFVSVASVAHAGPVEQLVQVGVHPSDPDTMVLRYDYGGEGLFLTHDGGKTWTYICNTYIDPTTNARRGAVSIGSNGDLLLGVFDGIWTGSDQGCAWKLASDSPVMKRWVSDITPHPTDPALTLAVTSNGDEGVQNGIVVRDADGKWTEFGSRKEALITRLRAVANGDGIRYYESAVIGTETITVDGGLETPVSKYYVRVSDDAETFEEFRYQSPIPGDMRQFRLQAVDPSNPDRIVASAEGEVTSHVDDDVLISTDRGQTFTVYKTVTELSGVVFAPDGRVFVGDKGATTDPMAPRGLWTAPSLDEELTSVTDKYVVSCLTYNATEQKLFACQLWQFGTIDLDSGDFNSLFNIKNVEKFASCEDNADMAATCQAQLCRDYCATGHFPETPMCVAYQTQTCGPCAAIPAAPGCSLSAGTAGSSAAGSTAMSGGTTGGSAGTTAKPPAGGSGASDLDAGTGPGPKAESSDGGGCRVASDAPGEQLLAWLLIAGAVLGIRRRSRG